MRVTRIYQAACQFLWVAVVVLLPITSFPLLVDLVRAPTVAPPATVLLVILVLIWLLPYLLRRGKLPAVSLPLALFVGAAVISWAASFFIAIPPYRDRTVLAEGLKAFVTLGMGLAAYYVTAAWVVSNRKQIPLTLQCLNWSGLVLLIWSIVQSVFAFSKPGHYPYPFELVQLQNFFSSRHDPLFVGRVTGLAYEPSWFAHQLNMIYLPIWFSATLNGYTAHRRKFWRISFENILLVGGVFMLFASVSRVGWLSFLLVAAYVTVGATLAFVRRIERWIFPRLQLRGWLQRLVRWVLPAVLLVVIFATYAASIFWGLRLAARFEPRLERILQKNLLAQPSFYEFTNALEFAERVVFWAAGVNVFGDHPLLGVGLGNTGFFFSQKMPSFGWALTETVNLLNRLPLMPNNKALWVRILAETGLLGFSIFLGWYFLLWQSGRLARRSPDPRLKVLGLAGLFVLIAFLTEGFSIDSLALPYFWFATGLLSAAGSLARQPE